MSHQTIVTAAKRIFLPGIILQSVLIGGGYATGREIVEYGGKFGAGGWISGLAIFLGFSLLTTLSIEACRQWNVYDYKSLLKCLTGKGWIAYEVVYLLGSILTIAVMAAAAGEILNTTLGLNNWIGIFIIILIVGFLNYKGDDMIAKFETIGTIALFITYSIFSISIFSTKGSAILNLFYEWNTSSLPEKPSLSLLLWTGMLYVGYNLGVFPASLFTYRNISSRKQSITAGLIAGLLMTIPWFLTYFALMAYYPDKNVIEASVPWLQMLAGINPVLIATFSVVMGWTLIETATGMIHAFISRVETEVEQKGRHLTKMSKAYISITALLAAVILSQVGIIDLVAKGYRFLAYALIVVYAAPLILHAIPLWRGSVNKE